MRKILFILFGIIPVLAFAQHRQGQALIDSLVNELNTGTHKDADDTVKLNILADLSYEYYNIDPEKGIRYGQAGLHIAQKLNRKADIANIYYYLGANYCVKADYPTAMDYWLKALKINEELGDTKRVAGTLENLARIFVLKKNSAHALEYYLKALSIREALKDTLGLPATLGGIGTAYQIGKDFPRALEYYNKALAANTVIGDKDGIADNVGNLGSMYLTTGDYSRALKYCFLGMRLNAQLGDKSSVITNMGNIGICYLRIAKDTSGKITTDSLIPAGRARNLAKAIEYLGKSAAMARQVGNLYDMQDRIQGLSTAEELLGDYKSALQHYKIYATTKDSVFNIENNVKITNLETRRALDIKQKDIEIKEKQIAIDKLAVAKKRNERGYFIASIGLLGCIIIIVYRNYKKQEHNNRKLSRTNSLLSIEKNRSDDLLLNILPSEVAEELKRKGNAAARLFDHVTVLFTDFVSFTEVSEKLSPNELVAELDTCFKAFDDITDKYNVEKIKTIGDAYLAVAGLPTADPKHAENAVSAAIEINKFMAERFARLGERTFQVRIGIHTGSVVAGIVGVKKFAYDIWGDTVNTAARMQQKSEPGKINISQPAYELVKDKITCTYRGEIEAKGKGMLKMYYVE